MRLLTALLVALILVTPQSSQAQSSVDYEMVLQVIPLDSPVGFGLHILLTIRTSNETANAPFTLAIPDHVNVISMSCGGMCQDGTMFEYATGTTINATLSKTHNHYDQMATLSVHAFTSPLIPPSTEYLFTSSILDVQVRVSFVSGSSKSSIAMSHADSEPLSRSPDFSQPALFNLSTSLILPQSSSSRLQTRVTLTSAGTLTISVPPGITANPVSDCVDPATLEQSEPYRCEYSFKTAPGSRTIIRAELQPGSYVFLLVLFNADFSGTGTVYYSLTDSEESTHRLTTTIKSPE